MLCVCAYQCAHMYGKKYVFCIRYCKSDLYVILKLLEYVIQKIYKTKQKTNKMQQCKQKKHKYANL